MRPTCDFADGCDWFNGCQGMPAEHVVVFEREQMHEDYYMCQSCLDIFRRVIEHGDPEFGDDLRDIKYSSL